jgi:hypothetical protein
MFALLFFVLLFVTVGFAAACLRIVWLLAEHPIAGVPIAVYIGLDVWLGSNDAQALMCYAVIALAVWRLAHRHSFERLVGRRLRRSGRRSPPRDRRPAGARRWPPAAPGRSEEPMVRMRTAG